MLLLHTRVEGYGAEGDTEAANSRDDLALEVREEEVLVVEGVVVDRGGGGTRSAPATFVAGAAPPPGREPPPSTSDWSPQLLACSVFLWFPMVSPGRGCLSPQLLVDGGGRVKRSGGSPDNHTTGCLGCLGFFAADNQTTPPPSTITLLPLIHGGKLSLGPNAG